MITSAKKKLQNLFLIFLLHLCNYFANISTSDCPTIVSLIILSIYIHIFEYNLYIGDVKVSSEG